MNRAEMISKLEIIQDGIPTSFEAGMVLILIDGILYKQGCEKQMSMSELKWHHEHNTNLVIHMCDEDPVSKEVNKILSE
jgi:hypothetical protein